MNAPAPAPARACAPFKSSLGAKLLFCAVFAYALYALGQLDFSAERFVRGLDNGALEGSNVNPVECMVGMIAASRQFEQQMKLLQTAQTNDKTASQLLSMNG